MCIYIYIHTYLYIYIYTYCMIITHNLKPSLFYVQVWRFYSTMGTSKSSRVEWQVAIRQHHFPEAPKGSVWTLPESCLWQCSCNDNKLWDFGDHPISKKLIPCIVWIRGIVWPNIINLKNNRQWRREGQRRTRWSIANNQRVFDE